MIKVIVKPDLAKEIIKDDDFILAIQLSRIVNGLRSNLRTILTVSNNSKMIETKDRIDLILIHGSMLHEALKVFMRHNKKFRDMEVYQSEQEAFKEIGWECNDNKSFNRKILKFIRNKLFFHFDHKVVFETLQKMTFPDGITFLQANSKQNKDVIYTLSDDVILAYLTGLDESKSKDGVEKYQFIENDIIKLSKTLGDLIEKIIKELLNDTLVQIKETS